MNVNIQDYFRVEGSIEIDQEAAEQVLPGVNGRGR